VACWAARLAGVPAVTMTSSLSWARSTARSRSRSASPSAHRYSTKILALDVAKLAQPLTKGVRKQFRHIPKIPDPGECRLRLRRGEWRREQAEGEGDEEPDGATHPRSLLRSQIVGAFYALHARQGNQILQITSLTSVEKIRGHTTL
jgi:hypothetical protein